MDAARAHLDSALNICEELGTRVMRGWTRAALAEIHLRGGAAERGRRLLEAAREDLPTAATPGDWSAARRSRATSRRAELGVGPC